MAAPKLALCGAIESAKAKPQKPSCMVKMPAMIFTTIFCFVFIDSPDRYLNFNSIRTRFFINEDEKTVR
jgi:hypothetical protein